MSKRLGELEGMWRFPSRFWLPTIEKRKTPHQQQERNIVERQVISVRTDAEREKVRT